MYCEFCNHPVDEDTVFCPSCGIQIREDLKKTEERYICRVCGAENPPGSKKCNFCCSIINERI